MTRLTSLTGLLAVIALPLYAEPNHVFPPIKPEELAKIQAALPKAQVKPAQPRQLLVFYRTEGFVHGSIPYGNEALKQIGEKTGAYRADFSDDMGVFTPENLSKYDAVLFNNTTQLKFEDPATRQALLDFVKKGKGLVGLHAASDNFPTWPEAQALLGGKFKSHPWVSKDIEAVKLDDPTHPVIAAFQGQGFWINDEIYQIIEPYRRTDVRVLLSLDMSKPENQRDPKKIVRTDNDFPISWIKKTAEGGRVFYSSLGHNPSIFWTPQVLQHYVDGIQFALGDLPAPSEPSSQITPTPTPSLAPTTPAPLNPPPASTPKPATSPAANLPKAQPSAEWIALLAPTLPTQTAPAGNPLSDGLAVIKQYTYGTDRTGVVAFEQYIRSQPAAEHAKIEAALLPLLTQTDISLAGKDWICRWLGQIGSDASVPTLGKLAVEPTLSHFAVYALLNLNTPAAQTALNEAVLQASASLRPALINAVSRSGQPGAIPTLAKIAALDDKAQANAALAALASIGTAEVLPVLQNAHVTTALEKERQWALLNAAFKVLKNTPTAGEQVKAIFSELMVANKNSSSSLRVAAAQGFIHVAPSQAWTTLAPMLKDSDATVRLDSAQLMAKLPDEAVTSLIAALPSLDPKVQIVIVNAFAGRSKGNSAGVLQAAVNSSNPEVHLAALQAYGQTTLPNATSILLPYLSKSKEESAAAASSLGKLSDPAAASLLRTALTQATNDTKAVLLTIMADRVDRSITETAFTATQDTTPAVVEAAFYSVSQLATSADFPRLLTLLPQVKSGSQRKNLEKALSRTAQALPDKDKAAELIITALANATPDNRNSLLATLAFIASPKATAELHQRLQAPALDDRKNMIRTLSTVRNPAADELLLEAATKGVDPSEKILALRGFLDSTQAQTLPDDKKFEAYKEAWGLAVRSEERDAILSALKNMRGKRAEKILAELTATLTTPPAKPAKP